MEEVKRKANPGEYIKLTNDARFNFNRTGDILKVHSVFESGTVGVLAKDHPRDTCGSGDYEWYYCISDYVVLEGYTPEEKPEEKVEKPKFKVGDRVRFRDWDDMAKEFGTDNGCNIPCKFVFVKSMRQLCGTYATIESIDGSRVFLKDFTAEGDPDWIYSTDMIELAEETLKTFEMVAKAEGDGQTYSNGEMYYNRQTGFTDKQGDGFPAFVWADVDTDPAVYNALNRSGLYRFIHACDWKPVEEEPAREMTLEEIEKELGYKIKIK